MAEPTIRHPEGRPGRMVAVITGGSRGIGAGLVAGYRRAGWSVATTARSIAPSDDPDVLTIEGDISHRTTAERIVDRTLQEYGRIDTLINNAGLFVSKAFTEYTADDYADVIGVNLAGFFHLTQRTITEMLHAGKGNVVNISATLVDHADSSTPAALTAMTKGGIAAVTRSLAIEYAARGIRVNAVSPGVIRTHPAADYDLRGDRRPPLGRIGDISDIVDAVLFLESAPYVTGEIVHVDGGQIAGH